MDETYREYVVPNGRIYPQKVDSLQVITGYNRLKISWLRPNDPKVEYARIYWDNYIDSQTVTIPEREKYITADIENLEERTYTLYVKTFDEDGNSSIPSIATGTPYGKNYIVGQTGRAIVSAVKTGNDGIITWSMAPNAVAYTKVRYTTLSGEIKVIHVPNDDAVTICPDVTLYGLFEYCSGFRPEGGLDVAANEWRFSDIPFGYQPVEAYLTGDGSEGGANLSKAHKMTAIADGVFEVYTRLEAGKPYFFTNGITGNYRKFHTTANGLIREDGTSAVANDGVYRIILDFNTGVCSYALVTRIGFFFSPEGAILFDLPYKEYGIFQATATVTFKQESWGRDERYKFRMFVREENGTAAERQLEWGTLNQTDSRPTAGSPESYYYLHLTDNLTQWDNKWKLMGDFDGVEATYTIYLTAEKPYTHTITK